MSARFHHAQRLRAVRLPAVGEMLSLWLHPHLKDPEIAAILRTAEVRRFVTGTDGVPIDRAEARDIVASPETYGAYRQARNAELSAATEGGSVTAECPHCRDWHAQLAPLAIAVGLRTAFWPLVDVVGDPAVPAAATASGRVAGGTLSCRLSLTLPGRPEERLPLGDIEEPIRLAQWTARSAEFFAGSPTEDWTPDSPGWIALLRLASAVPRLLAETDAGRVLALTRIPLADVVFTDNVHYLTRLAPIPDEPGLVLHCSRCAGEFLPLGRSPAWSVVSDTG